MIAELTTRGVEASSYQPIGDYGLIGDCRGAALVSREGSIDWLCFPRFDSPSLFAALLDADAGGRFRIRPTGEFETTRRYLPDTNVLETTFRGPGGACILRDLMPVASETDKRAALTPDHEVLREIEGTAGTVEIEILYEPRPGYGRLRPEIRRRGALGLWCEANGAALILRSELPLELAPDGQSARGRARIRAGERSYLALAYSEEAPAVVPPLGQAAQAKVERSARWWREWAGRCAYQGPYREAVVRSALTLKLLTYAPSGAIIAAPTTSLPEKPGGSLNWDYRYCWLRDASLTLRTLFALDYDEEANAFLNWLLHATRLTWPKLQVVYDVFGEATIPERELSHLAGYAGSRPVRVGNDAHGQLQLDVYGEIADAAAQFARRGGRFDRDTVALLRGIGDTVSKCWGEPDAGIWESRSNLQHYTHSKVLCWVALDRLIKLHEAGHLKLDKLDVDRLRRERAGIHATIEARGYNERIQSYTQILDGDRVDASLLALPLYGYIDAAHPRMQSTFARIQERLGRGSLLHRTETESDDLLSGEGAFGMCSFWAVDSLARAGQVEAAQHRFEQLLGWANELGFFAEEIDPASGAALGNFPQAFTHIGLINAALTLAECRTGRSAPGPAPPGRRQTRSTDEQK